jgi:sec-independent protein translocase protein TatA
MHWIILGGIALLVFGGRGKLSGIMGDAAKGVRAFREGLKADGDKTTGLGPPLPATEPEKDLVR